MTTTKTMGAWLLVLGMAAFGAGCTVPVDTTGAQKQASSDGADGANAFDGDPMNGPQANQPSQQAPAVDANTRYVPEQDNSKATQIAQRMWATMTAAPCWYLKSGNSTVGTYNYSFSGYNDYRYAGYETTAGQIQLLSAGKFGPYDTAEVVISTTQYWIAVIDAQWIAITSLHHNGEPVINYYYAASPGQLCV